MDDEKAGAQTPPVVIKKYANRRLYNTESATYMSLDDLSAMLRHGRSLVVRGAETGQDITDAVLEQHPDAVARVVMAARQEGVLVRPLGRAVAASPPLTVTTEHFALIARALARGFAAL